jgi:hypothetical protein
MPDTAPLPFPVELFYSYSHNQEDENLRNQLNNHLMDLQRQRRITAWHDRLISPGDDWERAIDEHLNRADIILPLISADFIGSDYCYEREMQRAMERHQKGEARVIPVVLRACRWHEAPFGSLQGLPTDGKPITSWENPDEAFKNVADGISIVVKNILERRAEKIQRELDALKATPSRLPAGADAPSPESELRRILEELQARALEIQRDISERASREPRFDRNAEIWAKAVGGYDA